MLLVSRLLHIDDSTLRAPNSRQNGMFLRLWQNSSFAPLAAVEVAAYRIVQEAVTNVIRHAHAHSCCVDIQVHNTLQIDVSDDGKGIEDTDRAGVGLISMRERAEELGGTFTINKASPCGTQIMACLPLAVETKAGMHL
jgi:signal transduction histidine kinase